MKMLRIIVGLPIALCGIAVVLFGVFIADGPRRAAEGISEIGGFIDEICKGE